MNIEVICSCGHKFSVRRSEAAGGVSCPHCHERIDVPVQECTAEDSSPGPKGLWAVMGGSENPTEGPPLESNAGRELTTQLDASDDGGERPVNQDTAEDEKVRPRGLWSVMQTKQAGKDTSAGPEKGADTTSSDSDRPGQDTSEESEPREVAPSTSDGQDAVIERDPLGHPLVASSTDRTVPIATVDGREGWAQESLPPTAVALGRCRNAVIGFFCGFAAVPLSAIGMVGTFWSTLPGTLSGLAGMILGMIAAGEVRASRGKMTGTVLARLAMLAGMAGMFLGPVVFSPLGKELRYRAGRGKPIANLTQIGKAFDEYHSAYDRFPSGGTYSIDADGSEMAMHSWMTALLPYLGNEPLYHSIDFEQPFDAPDNREAMQHVVPVFLTTGVSDFRTANGLGLAHFAGVGGELNDPRRGILPLGVLGQNSVVRRDEVSDGLTQTLVAGEIANSFPAWGDPDNLRRVRDGINVDFHGFGNADGTGATFLFADGSVRFFSSEASPQLLIDLSTRTGNENVPVEFR